MEEKQSSDELSSQNCNITNMEYLIKSVQSYPCLWDTATEEYKTIQVKENAWRSVSAQCNISDVREAKHIWKKLRDSHRQALRKRTSGHYWKYENLMKFLLPHLKRRSLSTSPHEIQSYDNTLLSVSDYDNNESENSEPYNPEIKKRMKRGLSEVSKCVTDESWIENIGAFNSRNYKKMRHLIKTVQSYPCLWDTGTEEYKTAQVKEIAWKCVTKQCGISNVSEAKHTWKKLRDSHRQALRKTKPGHSWRYEKAMEFLLPHLKLRSPSASQYDTHSFETSYMSESDCDNNESENSEVSELKVKIRKKSKLQNLQEIDVLKNEQGDSTDIFAEEILINEPENFNSSLKSFFDSMGDMCKSLPEYLQIRVQRSVFNIVMDAREETLKKT